MGNKYLAGTIIKIYGWVEGKGGVKTHHWKTEIQLEVVLFVIRSYPYHQNVQLMVLEMNVLEIAREPHL